MNIFCYSLLVLLLASRPHLTTSQEVEDEKEFDYIKGSGKGPEDWGDIHEEWQLCKNGEMQSPIDLMHERVQVVSHLGRLKRSYKPSNATLKNRGHDIMLKWVDDAGSINVNGTDYELKQCHWHSPSEHTINGRSYDLEVHMVHQNSENKSAVVGILYTIGRPDTFLSEVENAGFQLLPVHLRRRRSDDRDLDLVAAGLPAPPFTARRKGFSPAISNSRKSL
ncbi:hypothetical protein MRB53_004734 [Persea americana]|uniref:Uncharacterized protein n=1 Tax=Persea americana TaxID=3435 RepID=A0ACC2MB21_PERAE|nr:hypothetical protein MRB53_004734 [Persea americana]